MNHSDSNYLPSIQTNEFLPPLGRWTTIGALIGICAVGLAIPIAAVTNYKVTVKGQAIVRPSGDLRLVQAATEGEVLHIFAVENQAVKTGDVIATIDSSRLQTKQSQLQSNIQQNQLQLGQINAQISALAQQITAETDRTNRAVAAAQAEFLYRNRGYRDQQIISTADVEEAEANVKAAIAGLSAAGSKQARYEDVVDEGAISQDQFEEVQLAVRQQEQIVEAAKAKLQRVQAALNPSRAEVTIAQERIAQEQAAGEASIATLNKEHQALIQQRIEVQKQLEQDSHELQQVTTDLSQAVITATADGVIAKLNLRNPGQTVPAGAEIAQIVPGDAPLEVKAAVAVQDKNKLQPGQAVQMRISACPYPDYGTLKGQVVAISPDAIDPQRHDVHGSDSTTTPIPKTSTGNAFYEVTIKPESLALSRGNHQCPIQSGMVGSADIISREESVLQFLLRKARLIANL